LSVLLKGRRLEVRGISQCQLKFRAKKYEHHVIRVAWADLAARRSSITLSQILRMDFGLRMLQAR
jgi:hypothetical protein